METKICSHCHQELPLEEFHNNLKSKDGKNCTCKNCRSIIMKERRLQYKNLLKMNCDTSNPTTSSTETFKPLSKCTPRELLAELKSRGYIWKEMYVKQMVDYNKI